MSIDSAERSAYGAAPQELYAFTSNLSTWNYTNWDQDVTRDSVTYLSQYPISRNEPELSKEARHAQLKIETTRDFPVADLVLSGAPHDPIWVNVYRTMMDETEKTLRWGGKVVSCTLNEVTGVATLLCEPVEQFFGKAGFRHSYGPMCRKRLYSSGVNGCNAIEANYTRSFTLSAVSYDGLTLTAPEFNIGTTDWWKYGDVFISDLRRYALIVASSGNTVTLRTPIKGLAVGASGKIRPGCDHVFKRADGTMGDCKTKFDNTINFGGYPFTKTKNPYQIGLEG